MWLWLFADRLLLQRLRKSQSGTALYGEAQQAAEEVTEPSVYSVYEGTATQRLIVVANRLPVSAVKERDGSWSLQVTEQRLCKMARNIQAYAMHCINSHCWARGALCESHLCAW
jgi:hypothetical protein